MLMVRLLAVCLGAVSAVAASDPFEVTTPGKAGSGGLVPVLTGEGPGAPGSTCNALRMTQALPGSSAIMVLGLSELGLPHKGGVFGPSPDKLFFGPTADAKGNFTLPFELPPDLPSGVSIWTQFWIIDPGAFLSRSATNTLRFTVQESAGDGPLFHGAHYSVPGFTQRLEPADFDGDGALDVASSSGPPISGVTVRRNAGDGTFTDEVFTALVSPGVVRTCELNDDGVPDLLAHNGPNVTALLGNGDGSFSAGAPQSVTNGAEDLLLRDLDGDGFDDLVLLYDTPNQALVRLGRGNGIFNPPTSVLVFVNALALDAADMDGDGDLDLVVLHSDLPGPSGGAVTVMLGDGAGGFGAPVDFAAGANARAFAVGDVDADGTPDALVLNGGSQDVSVLLGQGDGTFAPATAFPVGVDPLELVLLDADADGALDVGVTRAEHQALDLFLGDGAGGFASAPTLPLLDVPAALHSDDVDGDGAQDLVALLQGGRAFAVLLGADGGGFGVAPDAPAGPTPDVLVVADLDADGRPDAVTLDRLADTALGLTNQGDGTLGAATLLADFPQVNELAVGDLSGDGRVDLVIAQPFVDGLYLSLGSAGGFGEPQLLFNGFGKRDLTITDVDLDGIADLVSLDADDGDDAAVVLRGTGGGSFAAPVSHTVGANAFALLVGDVDGDGVPDLVATLGTSPRSFSVRLGLGDGDFGPAQVTELAGLPTSAPLLADFNGDGAPELALPRPLSLDVVVFPGHGDGSFGAPLFVDAGAGPVDLAAGDLDGDCVPDLVVANSGDADIGSAPGDVWVLPGVGDGSFGPARRFTAGGSDHFFFITTGPRDVELADFDLDGLLDVAVANDADDTVVLLLNQRLE